MNFISRAYRSVRKAMSPVGGGRGWWPMVREAFAGAWQRNQELQHMDLLASPIVYSCITLIANDIGKLRVKIVAKDSQGIWVEVAEDNGVKPVLRTPNRFQNHIQFKQWWLMSKLRFGNVYALKERDSKGKVKALYVLDPTLVTPLVSDDGSIFYQLGQDNLAGLRTGGTVVPASEIIHDRMNCLYHPLVGISPLYAAAIAAGIGIKIQDNTLRFFANSAQPGGILVAPGKITPENAKEIKEAWDTGYSGSNAGRVAVLGEGMKFEPMSRTAVDSQLIETLRWSDERICSVFHVPGYKVGVGAAPSHNNIEALDRAYYSDCLQSPIEEMEACLDAGLGFDGETKGVELDLDGLMRMDSKTQMETLKAGIDGSILAVNDARKRVNLPPLAGGETVYMQQQDYPLDQVRLNRIDQAESVPAIAQMSEADSQALAEAKALLATQKAIQAAREKVMTHV
ncbi:phage portal protein [Lampropedia aestuarii]|uniref:Phage portal protein n=1 Tax=Lampropedia aestuarii TaxID=2562762 RepID=A0A4S5BF57_9BURK|nr:phage portal protein [Lampropedia aestuarii]THJ30947.1 phage portal protein [Lampropedia aestuarii]